MALMTYPNMNAIHYKGYGGFLSLNECEDKRIFIENAIVDMEIQRGNTVYVETYCMKFEAFESQLQKNKELNNINLGV